MTVIFSNAQDDDCREITNLWKGLPNVNLVEVTKGSGDDYEERVDAAMENEDDTLILVGHGTTNGLLFPDLTKGVYLVHENNVDLIHAKNVLCLWCYASTFVETHNIHNTFATSMFISNVGEAYDNCIYNYTSEQINSNSRQFYTEVNQLLRDNTPLNEYVMDLGIRMDILNDVDVFNRQGLFYNE